MTSLRLAMCCAVAVGLLLSSGARAARCGDTYLVHGTVLDASGRGVPHAGIFILMDTISPKKSREQGIRSVHGSTDANGRFAETVVCGGTPNPCARNPKHVTVMVNPDRGAGQIRVLKLKNLEVTAQDGVCVVTVPTIELRGGF